MPRFARPAARSARCCSSSRGTIAPALAELESLAREAEDSPQLLVHLARAAALGGTRRRGGGEAGAAHCNAGRPMRRCTRSSRAALWQRGAGDCDAMRQIVACDRAASARAAPAPGRGRSAAQCRRRRPGAELLERGLELAPDSAIFLHFHRRAARRAWTGSTRRCRTCAMPQRRAPQSVAVRRNLVPALLRTGAAAEARSHPGRPARAVSRRSAADRISRHRAAPARATRNIAGSTTTRGWCNPIALRPPAPFADIGEFNAAFARELAPLHRAAQRPLEQSSARRLADRAQPAARQPGDRRVLRHARRADTRLHQRACTTRTHRIRWIGASAADYRISRFLVRAAAARGFHLDHVHPRGWLSSAYYVGAAGRFRCGDARAGWLKFGEPGMRIPAARPEHFVKPAQGMLVLFPSYLWHGTVRVRRRRPPPDGRLRRAPGLTTWPLVRDRLPGRATSGSVPSL